MYAGFYFVEWNEFVKIVEWQAYFFSPIAYGCYGVEMCFIWLVANIHNSVLDVWQKFLKRQIFTHWALALSSLWLNLQLASKLQ